MHQTLARPDLDDSDKWIRYRQALHGFATAARSADRSPSTDVAPGDDRDLPLLTAVAMQSVPQNAQGRAGNLVRFLESTHDIMWNDRGAFTIVNVVLPGTSI